MGTSKLKGALLGVSTILSAVLSGSAIADYELNLTRCVTEISNEIYGLHMLIFYVCVVIAAIVFGAMIWSIFSMISSLFKSVLLIISPNCSCLVLMEMNSSLILLKSS